MAKKTKKESVAVVERTEYPEVGTFKEQKELQKFYKKLSNEQLAEWMELEGLTHTPSDSEPINRMRMAMSILYLHFPKAPSTSKKKSKYADYTNEQLLDLALENNVVFETCDDERILRMRAIMALRAASIIE